MTRCCGTIESTEHHRLAALLPAVNKGPFIRTDDDRACYSAVPADCLWTWRMWFVKCCCFALLGKQGGDVTLSTADRSEAKTYLLDTFIYFISFFYSPRKKYCTQGSPRDSWVSGLTLTTLNPSWLQSLVFMRSTHSCSHLSGSQEETLSQFWITYLFKYAVLSQLILRKCCLILCHLANKLFSAGTSWICQQKLAWGLWCD